MGPIAIIGGIAILGRLLGKKSQVRGMDVIGAITKADRLAYLDAHSEILSQGFPSKTILTPKVRQAIANAKSEFQSQLQQGRSSTAAAQQAMIKYKREVHLTQKLLVSVLNPVVLGVKVALHKKILGALKAMGNLDARITSAGFSAPKPALAQRAPQKPKEAAPAPEEPEEDDASAEEEEDTEESEPTDDEIKAAISQVQGLRRRQRQQRWGIS